MEYFIEFTDKAKEDIAYHKKSKNKAFLNKLLKLLTEITQHPFTGTGKPEPLKYNLSGLWSRRINREHRIIYEVIDQIVYIISVKGHYK